jgi:antitoxin component YwqK of YwqJK toxin-antitoxin module
MDMELSLTLTELIKVSIFIDLGNFREDKLNGIAKFTWKDGKIYEGNFKDTKMHGRGKIYYPNGQVV